MNEKIKQLALQAGIQDNPDQEGLDLFAELIVKECSVALSPMLRDMISRGQAYDLIKQYFGVEE